MPIILGRPFLATGGAIIDAGKGVLKMGYGDHEMTFKVYVDNLVSRDVDECKYAQIVEKLEAPDSSLVVLDETREASF